MFALEHFIELVVAREHLHTETNLKVLRDDEAYRKTAVARHTRESEWVTDVKKRYGDYARVTSFPISVLSPFVEIELPNFFEYEII